MAVYTPKDGASCMRTGQRRANRDKGGQGRFSRPGAGSEANVQSPLPLTLRGENSKTICLRKQASQFPCPTFVIAALWPNICAKGLSVATWLEQKHMQGEDELSSKLQAFSLPSKSSKNLSFLSSVSVSVFCVCLCDHLLTPEKGNMIGPCHGVISELLERQQSLRFQIGLLAS